MKCPKCKKEWTYDQLQAMIAMNVSVASDGSFITSTTTCYHEGCAESLEFYFPLREINGKSVE